MSKGDLIDVEGVVVDALGGGQYSIQTDGAVIRASPEWQVEEASHPGAARRQGASRGLAV